MCASPTPALESVTSPLGVISRQLMMKLPSACSTAAAYHVSDSASVTGFDLLSDVRTSVEADRYWLSDQRQ